jgi:hypothetical protein
MKGFISQHKEFGTNSIPRRFQPIVKPPHGKKLTGEKCCTILASAFSKDTQIRLDSVLKEKKKKSEGGGTN